MSWTLVRSCALDIAVAGVKDKRDRALYLVGDR